MNAATARPALPRPSAAIVALAGPALAGAVLNLPFGPVRLAAGAALLPAILLGVTLVMVPALYIGATLLGAAPPVDTVAVAAARGLRACGILLLGLCAPSAFLLATAHGRVGTALLTLAVVGGGAAVALRTLYRDVFPDAAARRKILPLFVAWTAVTIAIGCHFVITSFHLFQF